MEREKIKAQKYNEKLKQEKINANAVYALNHQAPPME